MGLADIRVERQQSIELLLDDDAVAAANGAASILQRECEQSLEEQNVPAMHRRFSVSAGLRVRGSENVLSVAMNDVEAMKREFMDAYRQRFGTDTGADELVMATLRVDATGIEQEFRDPAIEAPVNAGQTIGRLYRDGTWHDVPVRQRSQLASGCSIEGPAIITEDNGTTVIDAGWSGTINRVGHLLIERQQSASTATDSGNALDSPDPVRLEVFNRLFMHIAEQMGTVLQSTALSINIRERLDFSCALFDAQGWIAHDRPHRQGRKQPYTGDTAW
jgi:5-oxoprolinase (ATP-hydrolysing)